MINSIAKQLMAHTKKMAFLLMLVTFTTSVWASDVDVAEKKVVDVTSSVVNLLEKNEAQYSTDINALNAMVRREILPLIDFDAMSKLTLGQHWRTATPQQRQRFINAFREMLVKSYAKSMLKYKGANIKGVNSVPNSKPGYVLVRTVVTPKGAAPIKADYSVRNVGGVWKAYNVEIAGINLITNFRTNFTREASTSGLESLITRIEKSGS
ncbi:phospholipid-binding protein MlaC [uncultured Cocleimonas sp.]|uniref:MlaC/ttg2D family ABC transporter substrate-binding protein n=1 Tax=uncultured Cocleimonas sp. TaxID=1051587 RepID=UPI00263845AE|nr:ABC transporter substrate-binding protein [uncultured Cocleimonas sp.]